MTEGFDLYFLRSIAGFSSFIISDRRAKEVAQALTKGDIRPLFERITEPLRNEADHAPRQYSDEFILRTAAQVLINLCTDYRWAELGTTGFKRGTLLRTQWELQRSILKRKPPTRLLRSLLPRRPN